MAPITATTVGVPRQTIDDPALSSLLERLTSYDCQRDTTPSTINQMDVTNDSGDMDVPRVDVDGLVKELEKYSQWKFQEMVRCIFQMKIDEDFMFCGFDIFQ